MHPEIVRDAPGSCPKCGMTLIPMLEAKARAAEYTCPMHPEIPQPATGQLPDLRHGAGADRGQRAKPTIPNCATSRGGSGSASALSVPLVVLAMAPMIGIP